MGRRPQSSRDESSKPPRERTRRVGDRTYRLLERLSARSPRERWRVFDIRARSPRTLLMLPDDDTAAQHVRVLRKVRHGSLPRIEAFDRKQGQTMLILPWIPGIDLRDYLTRLREKKVEVLEPYQAIRLVRPLAHALSALHRHAGVIHADIKPANLLLTRKASRLHLIDFGSAWPIAQTAVRCEGDGMTPVYAAQELATGGCINERCDQFSLSVVLYELLTGQLPYDGLGGKAGWPEWYDRDNTAVPPSADAWSERFVPRRIWKRIDELVLTGMALNPGHRYATSGAWLEAVDTVHFELECARRGVARRGLVSRFLDWCQRPFSKPAGPAEPSA